MTVETMPFNKVFDLTSVCLPPHPECPVRFCVTTMKRDIRKCARSSLQKSMKMIRQPSFQSVTERRREHAIVESLRHASESGRSAQQRGRICARLPIASIENDWAGSIRESIHAVESVARQIAPEKTDTLDAGA